ncbi:MAG: tetratricopeptide repeat protein [bacterium]|nr:tetratricopeptide repeat protein [bacterium]
MFNNLFKRKKSKQDEKTLENYLLDAIDHFESGNFLEAADQFTLIAQSYPSHPLANLMLGRAYIHEKKYDHAIDAFFEHLKSAPNSLEALINLGLAYYECGELGLALERFEQALKLHSNSIMVRENIAITKLASGELNSALDILVSLHEENPDDMTIIELLILTYGKLGKWDTAKRYIAKMKNSGLALGL